MFTKSGNNIMGTLKSLGAIDNNAGFSLKNGSDHHLLEEDLKNSKSSVTICSSLEST